MTKSVIQIENVSVMFHMQREKVDNLKEYISRILRQKMNYSEFWALRDITFSLKKGERLGILGFNGAGKSTLLKVIAGVLKPTTGKVEISGIIAPLLELSAGFDMNYSGSENIYLYGATLGYSRAYIRERYDEIVKFCELKEFINTPVKNYSSGMRARLGFAIATAVEPEILILDEVLSVGDAKFRKKSEKKIQTMFDKGVTVLLVSHNTAQVRSICDRAILLEKGVIIAEGTAEDVCNIYEKRASK